MLSAHGSAPEVVAAARAKGRFVVNAVCPLVTKVHHEAKVRAGKGYTILYVGHAGHDEAVGTLAVAPESIRLVEHEADVDAILDTVDDPTKVALLAQTTLALHDWQGITDRARGEFPELWTATRNDLCFATTNRQEALSAIAARADAVVVIGSANSSNTVALAKVATTAGCPIVLRIDGPEELDLAVLGDAAVVGVTAGASAPEDLVEQVIEHLAPDRRRRARQRHRRGRVLPSPARAARAAPRARLALGRRARRQPRPGTTRSSLPDDRYVDASTVLADLAP